MKTNRKHDDTKTARRRALAIAIVLCAAMSSQAQEEVASGPPVDWWSLDRAVAEELLRADLQGLAGAAERSLPADLAGGLRAFDLMVRAGHTAQAAHAIGLLAPALRGEHGPWASHAADFLIERDEWDLARRLLEQVPEATPGWGYVFVRAWSAHGEHDLIDDWLAARAHAATDSHYWTRERVIFRAALGSEQELLDELERAVREHPADRAAAQRYLWAAQAASRAIDLAWMGDACRPALAYECDVLAAELLHRCPAAAVSLLERSLALDFTPRDQEAIEQEVLVSMAAAIPPDHAESLLRGGSRRKLAQAYLAVGRANDAQRILEQLATGTGDSLPGGLDFHLAGRIQAESTARVIEGRIHAAEEAEGDTSAYWLARGQYHAGRGESEPAIDAFARALDRAPLGTEGQPELAARNQVLAEYTRFLLGSAGKSSAVALLLRELEQAEIAGPYAALVVDKLAWIEDDRSGFLVVEDERLWSWLAARARWQHTETRLLWRMLANTSAADREPHIERAADLCADADRSRAATLGWILTRIDASARAIPLFRTRCAGLPRIHAIPSRSRCWRPVWPSTTGAAPKLPGRRRADSSARARSASGSALSPRPRRARAPRPTPCACGRRGPTSIGPICAAWTRWSRTAWDRTCARSTSGWRGAMPTPRRPHAHAPGSRNPRWWHSRCSCRARAGQSRTLLRRSPRPKAAACTSQGSRSRPRDDSAGGR